MNTTPVASTPVTEPAAAGILVSPARPQARLHDPAVRVVEVDVSRAAYNDSNIDGTMLWNIHTDLRDAEYPPVPTLAVQRLLERSGIAPHTTGVGSAWIVSVAWALRPRRRRVRRHQADSQTAGDDEP